MCDIICKMFTFKAFFSGWFWFHQNLKQGSHHKMVKNNGTSRKY